MCSVNEQKDAEFFTPFPHTHLYLLLIMLWSLSLKKLSNPNLKWCKWHLAFAIMTNLTWSWLWRGVSKRNVLLMGNGPFILLTLITGSCLLMIYRFYPPACQRRLRSPRPMSMSVTINNTVTIGRQCSQNGPYLGKRSLIETFWQIRSLMGP